MGKILCATRGGPDSQRTQDAAIALARERGDELIFLYVADASFLDQIAAPVVVDVEGELERLGRFQLAVAGEQAAAQGVRPHLIVRRGRLEAELVGVARETGADLILLGCPREETAVFDEAAIRSLAGRLRSKTGADVRMVGDEMPRPLARPGDEGSSQPEGGGGTH